LFLHRLSPDNGFQNRSFLIFRVQRVLSSLAGGKLASQLGVAWPQSSDKGYSSRPYGSRTALPTRRIRVKESELLYDWLFTANLGVKPLEAQDQSLSVSN
jgi:hypothetical protein